MNYILFTTTRCPKCPAFKEFVQKFVNFPGKTLNELDESFAALSINYNVSSVPHLFIFEGETEETNLFDTNDVAELYSFLNGHAH
ncbi:MAG: hypothetical protein A3B90_02040 [Candidatus Magasanikbacteria bacterium RIFCSPHIGHO2_02_FULL_41_13]|uniref:Thioredoxin-like fold domain-containing protein n=1 Tax=Candidatus Magasanikbacteria bacterium RIFCSPHIGHO2_02_FULL_41_13 TaxID=1798676 RepID=A0A1F6M639_9BACT|nr:MAG: hypothetical protein A3B90_02040 [Candidatus Magasanikbacteria bacterium RIFCSPHIGHO2_02_FULL_41_13]